ncbi:hypothetical protein [Dongia sp.]|uniref:hypothetical protein n=1 Tax=Dongia sp. TaxID=1977262 RepID=UPI003751BA78
MTFLPRIPLSLGAHAVSVAASARDGLRTAHYLVQELASADDPAAPGEVAKRAAWLLPTDAPTALITGFIAQNARLAEKVMATSRDAATVLLPRDIHPSPFDRSLMRDLAAATSGHSFTANAVFNAYFRRAALQLLQRYSKPPFLVLENRIDAARRMLGAAEQADAALMTGALIALVRAAPIAEAGAIDPKSVLSATRDPNVAILAIACAAALLGATGKPTPETDADRFFAITGALIAANLPALERALQRDDVRQLETELAAIKAMY